MSEVVLELRASLRSVGMVHKPRNNCATAQEAFNFCASVVSCFDRPPDTVTKRVWDAFFFQRRW